MRGGLTRRQALAHGAVFGGLFFFAYLFVVVAPQVGTFGFDAYSYWAVELDDLYRGDVGSLGFFPYSPPIAVGFIPLSGLTWPAFMLVWTGILLTAVAWMARWSVPVFLGLLAFPLVPVELYHANIHLLLAAAIVAGFRWPVAWAFVLLAKVAPGIGLLWFAVRGEWRSLAIALGATAIVGLVSVVLLPGQWLEWFGILTENLGQTQTWPAIPIPQWVRIPVAAAMVIWGARTDRAWTVPVAATLALPVLWVHGLSMLVAVVPLIATSGRRNRTSRVVA